MPQFTAPGAPGLYYELHGFGTAPVIVFLSGLTGDHNNWWLQVQSFSATHRCLTFDWRDTGRSETGALEDYDLSVLATDVVSLIEGLALGKCHLVGLSMGGAVAQLVALDHPALVRSLTLASSFVVRPVPSLLPPDKRVGGYLRHWNALTLHDTRNRLGELKMPVLVLAGADDRITPPQSQEAYASGIPDCRFVKIAAGGHLLQAAKAGEFNRQLGAFITQVEQSQ